MTLLHELTWLLQKNFSKLKFMKSLRNFVRYKIKHYDPTAVYLKKKSQTNAHSLKKVRLEE